MSNLCNSLNIKTLKISQLREYNTVNSDDIFLVIESNDSSFYSRRTTFGNILNSLKNINTSYVGRFTGSFSGSAVGKMTGSFTGNGYGNFYGGFTGSIISNNFKGTGSFYSDDFKGTGSFKGIPFTTLNGQGVSFDGRASYAVSSSYATYSTYAVGLVPTTGGGGTLGEENQFTYWVTGDTVGGTDYVYRSPSVSNINAVNAVELTGGDPLFKNFGNGTTSLTKPLYFKNNDETDSTFIGENIILKSTTGQSNHVLGMQENTMYLRADSNFVIYHSGSFFSALPKDGDFGTKDRFLNPGKNGYSVIATCKRLVGIGHFGETNKVNSLLHINLSGSKGYKSGYNPNVNAFLITSSSLNTTTNLLRVSGSGQLDVKGDIIAVSTFGSSDERLKDEIYPIVNSINLIDQLNPVQFKWKNSNQNDYGLIAQEVEQNYPELVKDDMNGYKTVKYNSFIPILIKSVQDLKGEIEKLKEKIRELEK